MTGRIVSQTLPSVVGLVQPILDGALDAHLGSADAQAMPIPDFQTLMLPLLRLAADGAPHGLGETIARLASDMGLTDAEIGELLPSGRQTRFKNRVGWSKTYLKKTGLLEDQGRGRFRITERGRSVLAENPKRVDLKYLSRFPELDDFRRRHDDGADTEEERAEAGAESSGATQTPEELLESAFQQVRRKLTEDLLDRLRGCTASFFEKVVVDLLVTMGYGGSRHDAGEAVGRSGDDGIDGIIKEDRLGLDAVYIQAKRWVDHPVGRPEVQAFAGSLEGHRARKGVFITLSRFTDDAREYVGRIEKKIVLIDGAQLATLMIEFGVGVAEVSSYAVRRVDLDYFEDQD